MVLNKIKKSFEKNDFFIENVDKMKKLGYNLCIDKEELMMNRISGWNKISKMAETLGAVHTHTHYSIS